MYITLVNLVFSIIASINKVFIFCFPLYSVTNGTTHSISSGITVNCFSINNLLNISKAILKYGAKYNDVKAHLIA